MSEYEVLNRLWDAGERRCHWPTCEEVRTGPSSRYCAEHTRRAAEWLPGIPQAPGQRIHVRSAIAPPAPAAPPALPEGMHARWEIIDLHVRAEGQNGVVEGIAVPWDVPASVADWDGSYTESFQRGVFAKTIREGVQRVKLLQRHNRYDPSALIGVAEVLTEDSRGLWCEFKLGRSPESRRAREDVEDGLQDGLSVGFQPIRDKWNPEHTAVVREEAKLFEVSLTPWPVYQTKATTREEPDPVLGQMRQYVDAVRERRAWEV
jgi:HK97 family phage prohead protease